MSTSAIYLDTYAAIMLQSIHGTLTCSLLVHLYTHTITHYTLHYFHTVRSTSFEGYSSSSQTNTTSNISSGGIKRSAPTIVSASDADAISAMLALAGATVHDSISISTSTAANDDTDVRPTKRARNNSGSSGSGHVEPSTVSFAASTVMPIKDTAAATVAAKAATAGTTVKRRSAVLLHQLAHSLVAEHPEMYAAATSLRQGTLPTSTTTAATGHTHQHGVHSQQQRATPSPVPASMTSNAPATAAAAAVSMHSSSTVTPAVPVPVAVAVAATALPEGQLIANGSAVIDVPLEENRYLCHIPQWAAALARQPKIAAPRYVLCTTTLYMHAASTCAYTLLNFMRLQYCVALVC
jgi:hypothetical protein